MNIKATKQIKEETERRLFQLENLCNDKSSIIYYCENYNHKYCNKNCDYTKERKT